MDELQRKWARTCAFEKSAPQLKPETLHSILESRAAKQKKVTMNYFWSAFILQMIVYSYVSHLIIRYWDDHLLLIAGLVSIVIHIPFTVVLLRKFKRLALVRPGHEANPGLPVTSYIQKQFNLLSSFYQFKRRYELLLVPLSTALLTWAPFRIYIPGGIEAYPWIAPLIFGFSTMSCAVIIHFDNKRYFESPLEHLGAILKDINP